MKPIELLQFAIKAELKERPIIIIPIFFALSIFIAAYILRATEMPADLLIGDKFGWKYMWNSMWCVFVTLATGNFLH